MFNERSRLMRRLGKNTGIRATVRALNAPMTLRVLSLEVGVKKNSMRRYCEFLLEEKIVKKEREGNVDFYSLTPRGQLLKKEFLEVRK